VASKGMSAVIDHFQVICFSAMAADFFYVAGQSIHMRSENSPGILIVMAASILFGIYTKSSFININKNRLTIFPEDSISSGNIRVRRGESLHL
jgi:hypothetical protein